jgi:hypothetical protein
MEIANEQLSKEANANIQLVGGNIVLAAKLDTSGLDVELKATLNGDYFIDLLAAAIPGQIDDVVLGMLKSAIKAV